MPTIGEICPKPPKVDISKALNAYNKIVQPVMLAQWNARSYALEAMTKWQSQNTTEE